MFGLGRGVELGCSFFLRVFVFIFFGELVGGRVGFFVNFFYFCVVWVGIGFFVWVGWLAGVVCFVDGG